MSSELGPIAKARVDGRQIPPVYMGHDGGFTDAGLSRIAAGQYRLTLSRSINRTRMTVNVTAEHLAGPANLVPVANYRWVSATVIEVVCDDPNGYGALDARFSIVVEPAF